MWRRLRRRWWVIVPVVALAAAAAWYLGSPLFLSRVVEEEAAAGSREVARGAFEDADGFHKGSGAALIVESGGQRLLRFEDFQVTNGPDLYVYLAAHPRPRSRADVAQGFINLGRLKGNIGAQNYAIPADADLRRYRSVVIYCRAFHVVFSTATLAPGDE